MSTAQMFTYEGVAALLAKRPTVLPAWCAPAGPSSARAAWLRSSGEGRAGRLPRRVRPAGSRNRHRACANSPLARLQRACPPHAHPPGRTTSCSTCGRPGGRCRTRCAAACRRCAGARADADAGLVPGAAGPLLGAAGALARWLLLGPSPGCGGRRGGGRGERRAALGSRLIPRSPPAPPPLTSHSCSWRPACSSR